MKLKQKMNVKKKKPNLSKKGKKKKIKKVTHA
jgi:hypothetical protein